MIFYIAEILILSGNTLNDKIKHNVAVDFGRYF